MKTKLLTTLLISGCLSYSIASAEQLNHVGDKVMNSSEIIGLLKPQPQILTRGIRLNQAQEQAPVSAQTISMEIQFKVNSAELTQQALVQLAPLGAALNSDELSGLAFKLEGHTDASGSDQYNLSLSQRRAQSVGQYLRQNFAVDPTSLQLIGKGETDLLDWNNPTSGVNRRVAITTLSQ